MTASEVALAVRDVRVSLGRQPVLHGVDLVLGRGRLTGILGPNGGGKTTLLRSLFRGVDAAGRIEIDGTDARRLSDRELARRIAAAVQEPSHPARLTVREVIDLGRFPVRGDLRRTSAADRDAIERAAEVTDVGHLFEREIGAVSGGERQRVHVARAVAQECPVLVLDEPTNHLDIAHQFALLDALRRLCSEGIAVVLALHDLALATRYCDAVVVLDAGRVVAYGPPGEVLPGPVSREVFGVEAWLSEGRLVLEPLGDSG